MSTTASSWLWTACGQSWSGKSLSDVSEWTKTLTMEVEDWSTPAGGWTWSVDGLNFHGASIVSIVGVRLVAIRILKSNSAPINFSHKKLGNLWQKYVQWRWIKKDNLNWNLRSGNHMTQGQTKELGSCGGWSTLGHSKERSRIKWLKRYYTKDTRTYWLS